MRARWLTDGSYWFDLEETESWDHGTVHGLETLYYIRSSQKWILHTYRYADADCQQRLSDDWRLMDACGVPKWLAEANHHAVLQRFFPQLVADRKL